MHKVFFVFLLAFVPALAADSATPQLFTQKCGVCHGGDATGSDRGPALANSRSLRSRSENDIAGIIRSGTPGGMPAMSLPDAQVKQLAAFVRSLNVTAFEAKPDGDRATGEAFFFGQGGCSSCHTAAGRGGSSGPDLSNVARLLTLPELEQSLAEPAARLAPGYEQVIVTLKSGAPLKGSARSRGNHDLQLQTADGRIHLLSDAEYTRITTERGSPMPALQASAAEHTNLVAFLSRLNGEVKNAVPAPIPGAADFEAILHPKAGDWPTYNGNLSGNRYSTLNQINKANVAHLQPQWIYPMPYQPLETTPLVADGVMYVTAPNQVAALDGRTGREIWKYTRPRTPSGVIAGDAALGANRGAALLGDRVFFTTDNAHMIALNRLTGALLWDSNMVESPQHYGGTTAPLVVGNLVISGVAGADEGIRGFLAAYDVSTGKPAWKFWTVPAPGEAGSETWQGQGLDIGGGSTWLTGTYDAETGLLYWPTGNPFPDTDGSTRKGDNLYTNCDLAIDPKTGKLVWYFQYTPHDLHDWDAVQPPVLVNAKFQGRERKLLLHANRNGFFYVLDRVTGEFLLGKPFVKKLTWASGTDAKGRPQLTPNNETTAVNTKTCPAVRGATNWYSTAYSPQSNLYYVMSVEDCGTYRQAKQGGFGFLNDPREPSVKLLRAIDIETGDIRWEIAQTGSADRNYSGVLATSAGLVFYGETSGGFAAVDAATGATLWHFETGGFFKASPMTYSVNGRQYVAIASGANILSFALPL